MEISYIKYQLFGGAIQAEAPNTWEDISKLIPVPDNQEVFNDKVDGTSAILEILERVEVQDDNAIQYFFNDLARHHDAEHSELSRILSQRSLDSSEMPFTDPSWKKYILKGDQLVLRDKRPGAERDPVRLFMLLIRYQEGSTDILFTLNLPKEGRNDEDFELLSTKIESVMTHFMNSFRIIDMRLFG
jgi:hypothetical protein